MKVAPHTERNAKGNRIRRPAAENMEGKVETLPEHHGKN